MKAKISQQGTAVTPGHDGALAWVRRVGRYTVASEARKGLGKGQVGEAETGLQVHGETSGAGVAREAVALAGGAAR
jgi:hypothetical protein